MNQHRTAVCIIVENLPVPLDRRVWQEASALTEAGYTVSIICPKGHGFDSGRDAREGIEIHRHAIWQASGTMGYLVEYSWALLVEFLLALKIYKRTRFRILQACNPPDTIFLIACFFKLLGVRFIFDHHDLNPELYLAKFGRQDFFYRLVCLAERLTFRTADVSIATNESYQEIAIGRGRMPPERTFVVRSCPDLQSICRTPPRPELKEGRSYLVVYLGIMGPQDGVDLLLDSIALIVERYNRLDTLFALIGSGTELPWLKAKATQKGLNSVVKFVGALHGKQLHAYLSTADVCVAPDPSNVYNDKVTMNKILEYMAFGKPVVLYDLKEGRRSAADAALYARPNDPEDFAQQILRLLNSEPLRRKLGDCARRRVEDSLNWEIEKRALLKAYETAVNI